MGVCASPVIRKTTKSIERSPQYGKYSKYKNTHEVIKNFCEKEFRKVVDKLYTRYDRDLNGILK